MESIRDYPAPLDGASFGPRRSAPMPIHQPQVDDEFQRFDYFMIRLTRSDLEPDRVAGLVERLGSGEKRRFETGEQLLALVGRWADLESGRPPAAHNPTPA